MAKSNWIKQINEAVDSLETDTKRLAFPKTRYHRLIINKSDIIKGFKNAAEMRARKKKLSPSQIAPYNTNQQWGEAFAAAWSHERKDMRAKPQLKTLNELKQLGDNKGLYIEEDTAEQKVILAVPMNDVGTGASSAIRTTGPSGRKKDGFDSRFRKRMWIEWLTTTGLESILGNYNADVGRELPSAHKKTLGQAAVLEYFRDLFEGIDQRNDEDSFFGQFVSASETVDVRQKIMDSIKIDWEQEEVPNYTTGNLEMKRVVSVEIVEVVKNRSNKDDLQYLKREIKQVIADRLSKIKAMDPKFAIEFESSKNFKDKQAELGAYVIATKLTKEFKKAKSTKVKKGKTTPKPKKKVTGGNARKSRKYTAHKGGSLNINKVVTPRALTKKKRKAVDSVLKVTNQINKRLGAEVRRNMGRPALINQTGDFSNSARLLELHPTTKGLSGSFTYTLTGGGRSKNRKNVYRTFENGIWPAGYNPKPLIAKSIRKLAMIYTDKKITSLRRT